MTKYEAILHLYRRGYFSEKTALLNAKANGFSEEEIEELKIEIGKNKNEVENNEETRTM